MKSSQSAKQIITLLLVSILVIAPVSAAQKANALSIAAATVHQKEADEDGVTFDNMLAASSYSFYIEARDIGQQVRFGSFNEIIEPLAPVAGRLPKEINLLARFIVTNADTLSRSRLMIAMQPARASLPPVLIALELASADAAQEFEVKIQELLVSILSPASVAKPGAGKDAGEASHDQQPPLPLPFVVKRAGRVLAFSPSQFTFKGLKAEGDKPISNDPNFRAAHDRFYSETLFLYYDIALSTRVTQERMDAIEKELESKGYRDGSKTSPPPEPALPAEAYTTLPPLEPSAPDLQTEPDAQTTSDRRAAGATAVPPSTSAASAVSAASMPSKQARAATSPGRRAGEKPKISAEVPPPPPPAIASHAEMESQRSGDQLENLMQMLMRDGISNGASPDAAALALTLENDSLILRALMVTAQGTPFGPIPFVSLLVSGPAQASNAANFMPADTDIFVTASLDLPRMYDTAVAMFGAYETSPSSRTQKNKEPGFESSISAFEKANGFKIRDEIAATLGNEVAVGIPARYISGTPAGRATLRSQTPEAGLLFLLSVRNKEALESKLLPVLEAIGLKSPKEKGLAQKHDDVVITSFGRASIAFINDYLVIGTDAATIRHALDARARNETLATSRDFHNYMQWQPRETLAQVYVSGAVMKDFFKNPKMLDDRFDADSKQFLARFSFEPEPITYAATSDVLGPLYELRVPKNLLTRVFAEIAVDEMRTRIPSNEMLARSMLQMLGAFEKGYKVEHGTYATLEELESFQFARNQIEKSGYKLDLTISGDRYEATATPVEYGKSGRLSFYTDQSGVVREGDHGGSRATSADKESNSNRDN